MCLSSDSHISLQLFTDVYGSTPHGKKQVKHSQDLHIQGVNSDSKLNIYQVLPHKQLPLIIQPATTADDYYLLVLTCSHFVALCCNPWALCSLPTSPSSTVQQLWDCMYLGVLSAATSVTSLASGHEFGFEQPHCHQDVSWMALDANISDVKEHPYCLLPQTIVTWPLLLRQCHSLWGAVWSLSGYWPVWGGHSFYAEQHFSCV